MAEEIQRSNGLQTCGYCQEELHMHNLKRLPKGGLYQHRWGNVFRYLQFFTSSIFAKKLGKKIKHKFFEGS